MYDDTPPPLPTLDLIHHPESDCYFYDVWCQGFAENLCSVVTDIPEHVAEAERRGVYPPNDDTPPPLPDEDLPPPLPDDDVPPLAPVGGWRFLSKCDNDGCGKVYPGDLDTCSHCGASAAFSTPAEVDPRDWGYDIETYPNVFTATFIHAETGQERLFIIDTEQDDFPALCDFIQWMRTNGQRGFGFNNVGFDYQVLHAMMCDGLRTPAQIYAKVQQIFASQDRFGGDTVWESDYLFQQVDLFKICHFDNKAKSTSLKALEIAMESESVVDLPFAPGTDITPAEVRTILVPYNRHDVRETLKFAARLQQEIHLREQLSERYGVNMLNFSNTKIGSTILIQQMEQAGIECYERVNGRRTPRQTYRHTIALGDVVFPYVRFERPEFNEVLRFFRETTIAETKGVFADLYATVDGFDFVFGVGGIHGSVESQTVVSDADYQIVDVDVTSFYPKMAIVNRMYPAHLGPAYCDIYDSIFQQRAAYPKGTPENAALKEALNASYGNSNNKYSPLYDPFYTMQTTINGQLMLCMLAEQLLKTPGLTMVQANTDGITVRCPRRHLEHMRKVCKWWEKLTGLQLEEALYSRMFIRDVNNYIAEFENGKIKRKGAYEYETLWHQDPSQKVVAKAAEAALVRGECPAGFIVAHRNAFDFMIRAKVPRSSRLVLRRDGADDIQLQNTTRVFVSIDGGRLYKLMPPTEQPGTWKRKAKVPDHVYRKVMAEIAGGRGELDAAGTPWDARIHTGNQSKHEQRDMSICSGWNVTECARASDFDWDQVDYGYYVTEALKLIDPLT